jgi:RNA polymerase sigma-70 factor (ECF subfamily)
LEKSEQAFKEIVTANRDRIYRICCYYSRSKEDREDLYQNILINVWNNLGSFKGQAQLSTWIYRVAINTSLDYLRKEGRRQSRVVGKSPELLFRPDVPGEEADPDREQEITDLYDSLNLLPVMDKAIMALVLEQRSSREIAEIIGITESNVRVKIHRIKESLRELLKGKNHGNQ